MKIIICTENTAKVKAVKEVLEKVWTDFTLVTEKFSSDITEQPLSEEEGVKGAINRANNARLKYPEVDYFIGMEGYVDTNNYGMFLAGIVVIINNAGEMGIGSSAKMPLPVFIQKKIEAGFELGPVIKELMNDTENNIRQYDGTNGLLSKGLYNRVDEFKDATKCALAPFQSPEFYESEW
jgi:inosine/xanthosine triphosphatase